MINIWESQLKNHRLSHSYLLICRDQNLIDTKIEAIVKEFKITSFDRLTIGEDKNIKIMDVKKLHNWTSLKPYSSQYKLALIKNAELLTDEAANALLKILEETPPQSIIVLATSNKNKIISTITSRCQIILINSLLKLSAEDLIFTKTEINNLTNMVVYERFSFVDQLIKNDDVKNILEKLTTWLHYYKNMMISNSNVQIIVKEIQKSQKLLLSTNVNKKLLLENLVLKI